MSVATTPPALTDARLAQLLAGAEKKPNGCWIWTRHVMHGWPRTTILYEHYRADRAIYELLREPISRQQTVRHMCGQQRCVAPDHMQVVLTNHWTAAAPAERFLARVEESSGCWLWTGTVNSVTGYGYFIVDHKRITAHRFSYAHHRGPIPDGISVLHRCDVRRCVRPDHLFLGTQADNIADMVAKGRGSDLNAARHAKSAWFRAVRTLIAAHEDEFNALWDGERQSGATG